MTVTIDDLTTPLGEISPEMFPNDNLLIVIGAWLDQAVVDSSAYDGSVQDRAIKHRVYSRAYRTIARRLALLPNSATAEGISESVGQDRIRYFDNLASYHDSQWTELGTVHTVYPIETGTRSVKTKVVW